MASRPTEQGKDAKTRYTSELLSEDLLRLQPYRLELLNRCPNLVAAVFNMLEEMSVKERRGVYEGLRIEFGKESVERKEDGPGYYALSEGSWRLLRALRALWQKENEARDGLWGKSGNWRNGIITEEELASEASRYVVKWDTLIKGHNPPKGWDWPTAFERVYSWSKLMEEV